jgi:enoyl-CoA hydratase/carnithine racemase
MASYETVIYETRNRVAHITLNRPEKLNALSPELQNDLAAALQEANHDDGVRAVVMTGAGRAFCAGADMGRGDGEAPPPDPTMGVMRTLVRNFGNSTGPGLERTRAMQRLNKPIIGALNGWTLGAGFELAVNLDILIASEQAVLGAPEIRHGSTIVTTLPYLIGPMWAKRLLLTGDHISANKAQEIGLVIDVTPHDELLPRAAALAERIAMVPPLAVRLNKRMLDGVMEMMGRDKARNYASVLGAIILTTTPLAETADGRNLMKLRSEGDMRSFLEARDGPFGRTPL